ncbi:peptidoglycan DD-metalloendopeptidase family protein [Thalassospiraceae bacterium LMO-JJ14]|nr:peptidoglycan DD-metalloendopeptidase family protein [Thalassospiraceae bacterium LMO-JJ14]
MLCALLAVLPCAARADIALQLSGQAAEGGLLIGKTVPGAVVTLDGNPVKTSADGDFLLGFGRDDAGTKRLTVSRGTEKTTRDIAVTDRDFKIEKINGLPGKKVTPDPKSLQRITREKAEMEKAKRQSDPLAYFLSGFHWPARGRISGVYGAQRILNGKPRRPHYGTDIAAPEGTPVAAMAAGKVAFVHSGMFFNGKTVLVDHGLGLRSVYIHLSATSVKPGDTVAAGQKIGAIGATGRATGPHLHFGLTLDRTPIDPELVLGQMPE